MITPTPVISKREFEAGTGWELKPEGACKGEVCIPLPAHEGGEVDIRNMAEVMRLPLIRDEAHDIWVLGTETMGNRALMSAEAPELVLPDRRGEPFRLSSLKGSKVVLLAWAPY